jgi:hypothetical protein
METGKEMMPIQLHAEFGKKQNRDNHAGAKRFDSNRRDSISEHYQGRIYRVF